MKVIIQTAIIISSSLVISGCTTLSRTEKATLQELKSYGVSASEVQVKHPAAAAALNVLPGFGNFYLAAGTDESSQWMYGFLNLLAWPVSVVWGVPEAAIDATIINKKETVNYYTFDRIGKKEFAKLVAGVTPPVQAESEIETSTREKRDRQ
jgi:hypothetical protein